MKTYLKNILTAHPVIYGVTEYGNGYSRKIKVYTINNDKISGQFIDDITSMVAKVLNLRLNKKGQIYFRGGTDLSDIKYMLNQQLFNDDHGTTIKDRKL